MVEIVGRVFWFVFLSFICLFMYFFSTDFVGVTDDLGMHGTRGCMAGLLSVPT